jgi:hypothetical protein
MALNRVGDMSMKRRTLALLLLTGCGGCSSSSSADAAADADAASEVSDGFGGTHEAAMLFDTYSPPEGASDGSCALTPPPDMVPAGWWPFTDFSCELPLWIPPTPDQLPPPLVWESVCPPELPSSYVCRRIKPQAPFTNVGSYTDSMYKTSDGHWLINTGLDTNGYEPEEWIVADIDGPVRFAAVTTSSIPHGLTFEPGGVSDSWMGVTLTGGLPGIDVSDQKHRGFVIVRAGTLTPKVFAQDNYPFVQPDWMVNDHWIQRLGPAAALDLFPISGSGDTTIFSSASDPDSLQPQLGTLVGSSLVFGADNLSYAAVMAYDPVKGTHPLVRWPHDNTQGADVPGTDGVDLVWTYGSGHPPGEGAYAKQDWMTAPFSLDAATIAASARRFHSAPFVGPFPIAVGCGKVAAAVGNSAMISRLSDGQTWTIPGTGTGFRVNKVLALSCEEFFFVGIEAPKSQAANIYRIRLDSLGPGSPAD